MGIKEFAKYQVENQPDNIRDIKIDAGKKQKELKFDPERDIPASYIDEIAKEARQNAGWYFLTKAMALKFICPVRWEMIKKEIEGIHNELRDDVRRDSAGILGLWSPTAMATIIYPEHRKELGINEKRVKDVQTKLEVLRDSRNWDDFPYVLTTLVIISASQGEKIVVKSEEWNEMKSQLIKYRDKKAWDDFLRLGAEMRIINPERWKGVKVDARMWREMKKKILKGPGMWRFVNWIVEMAILAAHKVEVTENGLEITMHDPSEEYREKREPMPKRLRF